MNKLLLKSKNLIRPIYHRLKVEPYYSLYKINQLLVEFFYRRVDDIKITSIPDELNNYIVNNYDESPTNFKDASKTKIANLLISELTVEQFEKIDEITKLYETTYDFCKIINDALANEIRKYCKSPYTIVNTRMWITSPGTDRFGPNAMHTDGFYPGHLKIMLYPFGLNIDSGYLELETGPVIEKPPGTVIMFRNSDVIHAGVAGIKNERLVVEITILRTFFHLQQYHAGHPNGRHYKNFAIVIHEYLKTIGFSYIFIKLINEHVKNKITLLKLRFVKKINAQLDCKKINLGSGKKAWIGWRCFDALKYPTIETLIFDQTMSLPENVKNIKLFYSSHNLEHLDDSTVENIFNQVFIRLEKTGKFVIKMPDFEYLLNKYRSNQLIQINDTGVLNTMYTWPIKKVLPSIENKISMVFCGFMSKEYGNHFDGERFFVKNSYHGPAVIPEEELKSMLLSGTVRSISKTLNKYAILDKDFGQFNHQNAWSREDLVKNLEKIGFKCICSNAKDIVKRYNFIIPDIKTSFDSSMYLEFQKG